MTDPASRASATESALALRRRLLEATPTETVRADAISGRVLAEAVEAPADDPATDRATMDGYAVAAADEFPLAVRRGEVYPEDERPPMEAGEAVPVATGGRLPERADAVLKREDVTVADGRLRGPDVDPGTNVYGRGSNLAAGEELFAPGERLLPKDAVLLDDLGAGELSVRRRWSVAVLATGTELHEGRETDRDSHMLLGLARSWGHDAVHAGTVPDDREAVRSRLRDLAREHDAVLTSGGTGHGSRDYVRRALADLGDVLVSGTRTRPGKSTLVADLGGAGAVALPGRPVACHASALLYARPLLTGRRDHPGLAATAGLDVRLGPDGECVVPVTLDASGGRSVARPVDADADADAYTFRPSTLSSMTRATRADGYLLRSAGVDAGEPVTVVPFAGVERS